MKVVLTRERGRNEELVAWLPDGAEACEVPLTETRYLDAARVEGDLRASASSGAFASLVVTSSRSVPFVEAALAACSVDVEVFSVGPSTTRSLDDLGVVVCAQSTGGALELSRQVRYAPVLLLGAAAMQPDLAEDLRVRGLEVATVVCYETQPVEIDAQQRELLGGADVVVIGAPSAWSVAREHVKRSTWVVVAGRSTQRFVEVDHPRVVVGWGPSWRETLTGLDIADGESFTGAQ